MQLIADLHIHSRFSRACSKEITIQNLEKYARIKGVHLLGTGDFTHPKWVEEIKKNLKDEAGEGVLTTKTGFPFICQTEVSLMYSQGGKSRKVHHVILAPRLETAEQITDELKKRGRVDYDGRPIFGMTSIELVDLLMSISKKCITIPAHIWTPYFGCLGSKSGFDSIQECFQEKTKYIYAIETGLSSDPPMNYRLSSLDSFNLVSFSDMHSYWPWRIGREATLIETGDDAGSGDEMRNTQNASVTYNQIYKAIKTGDHLLGTVEVNPSYGIYHEDGHRNCGIRLTPKESIKLNNLCPKCGRPLTIGVLHRVEELADRPEGYVRANAKKFYELVPISEILSGISGKGIATQAVWGEYNKLIGKFGNEFNILLNAEKEELLKVTKDKIAEMIIKNRNGEIKVDPGYDGIYGKPIFKEKVDLKKDQRGLNDFFTQNG